MRLKRTALLGQKDHGKSTLLGSLLIETGAASQARIREARRASEQLGRKFEPAFILDSFSEEREDAMTVDTTRAQVPFGNMAFEFIDVPGHEELMSNMLSGASYADTALLLVSAAPSEGVTDQTKRHLFIAKLLGIDRLTVAVNKMDVADYSRHAFESVVDGLSGFLEKVGFDPSHVRFVPISAYNSQNLIRSSAFMPWYSGQPLMQTLMSLESSDITAGGGACLATVQGYIEGPRIISGRVLSGSVTRGEKVLLLPAVKQFSVGRIWVGGTERERTTPPESFALELLGDLPVDVEGSVICDLASPPPVGQVVIAIAFFLNPPTQHMELVSMGSSTGVKSMDFLEAIDPTTCNTVPGQSPQPLQAAIIRIALESPRVIVTSDKQRELGRFVLRDSAGLVAIAVVRDNWAPGRSQSSIT